MTKKVRIENADGSNHQLVVQTWQKGADGAPDVMLKEEPLRNPTDMLDGWVWQGQYLVVMEQKPLEFPVDSTGGAARVGADPKLLRDSPTRGRDFTDAESTSSSL